MEKRLLIAIILSIAVLLIWQALFPPPEPRRAKKNESNLAEEKVSSSETVPPSETKKEVFEEAAPPLPMNLLTPSLEKDIVVKTPFYTATFSSQGARLKSLALTQYQNTINLPKICSFLPFRLLYKNELASSNHEHKELLNIQGFRLHPLLTALPGSGFVHLADLPFAPNKTSLVLESASPQESLSFSWTSDGGITFLKNFTFSSETYFINYDFIIINDSSAPLQGNVVEEWLINYPPHKWEKKGGGLGGNREVPPQLIILAHNELKRIPFSDVQERDVPGDDIKWVGLEEKYFLSSIIPDREGSQAKLIHREGEMLGFRLLSPPVFIAPGTQKQFSHTVYLGPKDMHHLERGRGELGRVLSFGKYLDPIAKPMLFILKFFHSLIPNYGLAIIFLSVGLKFIFWPLTHKSQKSMKNIQKIQPKLAELKEKYKNNKEELQRKTLELYRVHKVNPLGGCLPILIQIPVFFALYRVLLNSIELRHAAFIPFWINDLSAKDPTYISPLLMGASMFIQQKMTPTTADPTQAKMMLLMPIIFTFMFLNFPSGLVLYWLITNILSIVQQYYINKHL